MKLSTIHYQYMGELHAKLYQNWWSGFRDIRGQDTLGHSFIIIRIRNSFNLIKKLAIRLIFEYVLLQK